MNYSVDWDGPGERDQYWAVTLEAVAFETKEDAIRFRDALNAAFCAMPEAADYACMVDVHEHKG